ncbi:LacI family DNA-binding transcriptional regulator [Hydrogenispora ethanolica]|uniref:LacI family DNA-binding transcriptional regulator n=1 Tax=Hydrogenispora ethanolica TaxID=1082276 RepID=UPI001FB29DC3|nr:LacI family DNA-binding transcriptional regulator [Hydrogenispora ethanolica]
MNIKEISKLAQVSTATVSNVLNNSPKVAQATRERVLRVIRETQYRPSTIAKSLKVKRTNLIGVISEDITVFNTPEIINGIDEYTENHGFHIILNNLRLYQRLGNHYADTAKYRNFIAEAVQILLSRQVDGIIYIGAHSRDISGIIEHLPVPIVYTYCYSAGAEDYAVNYDDEAAAYDAIQYLIDAGHRKIGVISGLYDSLQSQARFKGYQRALLDYKLLFNPAYLKAGDWERESGHALGKELLTLPDPPTAIFAMNDLMAGGVIDAANELGIAVPEGVSLIGFDNRECSKFFAPPLTTMALPLNEMGKQAVQILMNRIVGPQSATDAHDDRLKCTLVERQSVAKRVVSAAMPG